MHLVAVTTAKLKEHKQKIILTFVVLMAFGGIILFLIGNNKAPLPNKEKMSTEAPIYDVTKAVEDKSLWLFKAQNELSETQKKQEKLEHELEELKKQSKPQMADNKNVQAMEERIQQLEAKLAEQSLVQMKMTNEHTSQYPVAQDFHNEAPYLQNDMNAQMPTVQSEATPGIFSETLSLNVSDSKQPHIDSYIPAGAYAKAVLLSGVDVSAGVSSQSTPKPVLLRLVHKGSLPNKAVGKMKDCRIIAAAYGDLSSERAYMRLEKLSCVEPDGSVIETSVDGYISGEDGKNGVRGRVVMRDAEVLRRGFMGGLLSGLGKATSNSYSSTSVSPFGTVNTSTAKGADLFKQAGAQGAGDAFELMAKYNIQRAEQYQPVIQISAGRTVDVVFHSGSQFGEKKQRSKENREVREQLPAINAYGDR